MTAVAVDDEFATMTGYNEAVIRQATIATVFWGVVGFTVGVFIAFQLAFPVLNLGLGHRLIKSQPDTD